MSQRRMIVGSPVPGSTILGRMLGLLSCVVLMVYLDCYGAVLFSDDFERGLDQWVGKDGGSHAGFVVEDPIHSGRGGVLTFGALDVAGNIFSKDPISTTENVLVQFDYLGLPSLGGPSKDLGGFLGYSHGLRDGVWIAGTSEAYPDVVRLVDDGAWHQVTVRLNAGQLGAFSIMIEDWASFPGGPYDCYFDNVRLTTIPRARLDVRLSQIELCWSTTLGERYQLQSSSDLGSDGWVARGGIIPGDGSAFCTNAPVVLGDLPRFYRLVSLDGR